MWPDFVQRVTDIQERHQTDVALMLNPRIDRMPLPIQWYDDPFFPFGKEIVRATHQSVCVYVFDLASYLALGAAGAVALERTIAYIAGRVPTILHAPFTGTGYSAMADKTGFAVDALTVTEERYLSHYLENPPYAAFLVREQPVSLADTPAQGGILWLPDNLFTLRQSEDHLVQMRLTTDEILYAGQGDNFANDVREAIESWTP
jgi:hypothetical protein